MVNVRWTGAAGLEFTHDGKTWLIDPYHSRPGLGEILFGPLKVKQDVVDNYINTLPGELQAIVIGHTHFDHVLDMPEILKLFQGPVIGSKSMETLLRMYGLSGRVTICKGGETHELPGGAEVTMIPSKHGKVLLGRVPYPGEVEPGQTPPLKAAAYRLGTIFAPKLTIGGITFIHAGSANLVDEELSKHTCDVLFMCLPGWKRTPDYHRRMIEATKPRIIVPFHFDNFSKAWSATMTAPDLPFQGIDRFMEILRETAPAAEIIWPTTNKVMPFN
ncbi:MAG: MBL fold metallo-hydrolase [Deltaproteobacteria bacterium]|nr:MBL fold metallo-hydrolase [bacterium]MCB9476387.1 MBL fold metallo-hydrolase [Deltaproteobacteria bacterium]MCB9478362.1 MBL fold metallo-hydrolase [Deltaproteobacteria bacterium]MCB9489346.1 MBL fold metallo-hydrolase [Deltaproteobacteria bacterium]